MTESEFFKIKKMFYKEYCGDIVEYFSYNLERIRKVKGIKEYSFNNNFLIKIDSIYSWETVGTYYCLPVGITLNPGDILEMYDGSVLIFKNKLKQSRLISCGLTFGNKRLRYHKYVGDIYKINGNHIYVMNPIKQKFIDLFGD